MNLELATEEDFAFKDPKYFTELCTSREKSHLEKIKSKIEEAEKYKNDFIWKQEIISFVLALFNGQLSILYAVLSLLLTILIFPCIGLSYLLRYIFKNFKFYNKLIVKPLGFILYKLIYWQQDIFLVGSHRTFPFKDIELKKLQSEISSYCWYNVWYVFYKK